MIDSLVPPGAREEYVDLDGGRIRLLRAGAKGIPAIVLLHGGGLNNAAAAWFRLFVPLGEKHDVIAPDFPGFGGTTGIEPMRSTADLADLVSKIMERADASDAVVMGGSMGGETALNLALRHLRLVRGLVLISPAGLRQTLGGPPVQFSAWLFGRLPERATRAMLAAGLRSKKGPTAAVCDPSTMPEEVIAELRRESTRPDVGLGLVRYNAGSVGLREMRNNLLPVIDQVTVPTLFVHGERDPQIPPESSRHAAERMQNARYVAFPGCGHWSHLEDHDRFLTEVADFLSKLEPSEPDKP